MDTLSKNEAIFVKEEYDKMGFPSEIKQYKGEYICSISKKWYSYESVLPQVNDKFYILGEDENLPYEIISFEIENGICNLTVKREGADDNDLLEAKLNTFNILKTTPWTAKDKRDYFVKYKLPRKMLGALGVFLGIALIFGVIALLAWSIHSQTIPETLATLLGVELSEIQPLWRMIKWCLIFFSFTSIMSIAIKNN